MSKLSFFKKKEIFLIIFLLIACFSFVDTILKSLMNGCDFQWQPATLMWSGINHYEKFISQGNFDFSCQGGQYAHFFHVLLYPFTLVEWEIARIMWLITNIFFVFMIPIMVSQQLGISKYKAIILILIFITCYPARMTLNYGQQSLFVLFFLLFSNFTNNKLLITFSGFSYIKYSTGYILFLDYLIKKKFKSLFLSCLPYTLGWLVYFIYTDSNWLTNFFEPIHWIMQTGYSRTGDLYSILQIYVLKNNIGNYLSYFLILIIIALNILILHQINSIKHTFLKFSLVIILPLIFLPHSNYDYVLLFPLLSYSFLNYGLLINKVNFYFVVYYFYINRLVRHLINTDEIYQPIMMILMTTLVFINIIYNKKNKQQLTNINKV